MLNFYRLGVVIQYMFIYFQIKSLPLDGRNLDKLEFWAKFVTLVGRKMSFWMTHLLCF